MKVILDKPKGAGRRMVIELEADETLVVLKQNSFYRLAYPFDDQIMATHIIDSPTRVYWCSLEQTWTDA